MCWRFIKLIWVRYLSSWYDSHFYQLDMCWRFIHVDRYWRFIHPDRTPKSIKLICVGYSFNLIELQNLSTWYVLDSYQVDRTPIFISTWYVLDIYSPWYNSKIYQRDMCWIVIKMIQLQYLYQRDMCWIVIKMIQLQYLYQRDMCWIFIKLIELSFLSTWYVLDIYSHE
jgi:hypothetical protein